MKFLDRLVTALFGLEDNEAEASGPTGVTVGGHRSANNVVLLELVLKGSVGHFPGQTTDKCLDLLLSFPKTQTHKQKEEEEEEEEEKSSRC